MQLFASGNSQIFDFAVTRRSEIRGRGDVFQRLERPSCCYFACAP